MGQLLDAYGNVVGGGPRIGLTKLVNPDRKVFEGPISVNYYNDRIVARGTCLHCQSQATFELKLTKGQARSAEKDHQFRKNMFDYAGDQLQREHQCGLLFEGMDSYEDLSRDLLKERMGMNR